METDWRRRKTRALTRQLNKKLRRTWPTCVYVWSDVSSKTSYVDLIFLWPTRGPTQVTSSKNVLTCRPRPWPEPRFTKHSVFPCNVKSVELLWIQSRAPLSFLFIFTQTPLLSSGNLSEVQELRPAAAISSPVHPFSRIMASVKTHAKKATSSTFYEGHYRPNY